MEVRVRKVEDGADCWHEEGTINCNGIPYTAGGSYKTLRNGRVEYGVYYTKGEVHTWGGSKLADCRCLNKWRGNFGDIRLHLEAWIEGKKCRGILYNNEWNQFVRMREVKR